MVGRNWTLLDLGCASLENILASFELSASIWCNLTEKIGGYIYVSVYILLSVKDDAKR